MIATALPPARRVLSCRRMKLRLATGLVLAAAACGDGGSSTPDAPAAIDAAIDARACTAPTDYPMGIRPVSVDLAAPSHLALDGTGTRCEQIGRALTGAARPTELAQLDVDGVQVTCTHDDVLNREIVRLRAPNYGGLPLFGPVQDALVHVDASDDVVFLHGDFLPAGMAPPAGCLDGPTLATRVPGRTFSYQRFAACVPGTVGEYTIAADDVVEVGDEGVYQDADGGLRRVRAIDVYVTPAHATPDVTNSDAFCCSGPTLDHCIGTRLFLDALTGETVGQEPHCHTC